MFEEVLEETYKLKASDFGNKWHLIKYIDDLIDKRKPDGYAYISKRESLSFLCIYKTRRFLEEYDSGCVNTYTFRREIDKIKSEIGLSDDDSDYKNISEKDIEELSETLEIGAEIAENKGFSECKDALEKVLDIFFKE